MPDPDAVRDYLALAAELGHRLPGAVGARSGDLAAWRPRGLTPGGLVREAGRLAMALPGAGLEPARERFLAAQLAAIECCARRLAGQAVPFAAEIAACFGVRLRTGDEDAYRAAHRELSALLPGAGDLAARLATYRAADLVPRDRLPAALAACVAVLRERARDAGLLSDLEHVDPEHVDPEHVDPEHVDPEHVDIAVVDDAPWSALHRGTGTRRSEVRVNAGAPMRRSQLLRLVAHETYPGHHAEQLLREAALVERRGWGEHRVVVLRTPQSLIAEGAAELGLHVLGCGPEVAAAVLADVGLPFDAEHAAAVDACLARLARVRVDAAALLAGPRRARPDDVRAYLRRWLLLDDAGARRVLRFAADPRWRGQAVAYVDGAELVRDWLDRPGTAPAEQWRRLFSGAWTVRDLRRTVVVKR